MNRTRNETVDALKLIFSVCIIAVHVHIFKDLSLPAFRIFSMGLFRIGVPFYLNYNVSAIPAVSPVRFVISAFLTLCISYLIVIISGKIGNRS